MTAKKSLIPKISNKRIAELLKTIQPLAQNFGAGPLYTLVPCDARDFSFNWKDKLELATNMIAIGHITTFHTFGYHGLFKPSIAEVLAQIPKEFLDRTVAFSTTIHGDIFDSTSDHFSACKEYHKARTTLYAKITAVSVLIRNPEGKYLGVSRKDNPDAFGLGGGKVDPGETPEEAAVRELKEETGLIADPKSLSKVFDGLCPGGKDGKVYYVATYTCDWTGDIQTTEKGRVAWVTAKQLIDGPFGDYNNRLLNHLNLQGQMARGYMQDGF